MEISLNTKNVDQTLRTFPIRVRRVIADALDHISRSFLKRFREERLQGSPGIRATRGGIFHRFRRVTIVNGKAVFLRLGAGQSESTSAIAKSSKDIFNMEVSIYSKSRVAELFEKGGEIRPASGKKMLVPLNEEAKRMLKSKAGLEDLIPLRIKGRLFFAKKGRGQRPEILFVVKNRIQVRPRLGFFSTWESQSGRREAILNKAFNEALEKI